MRSCKQELLVWSTTLAPNNKNVHAYKSFWKREAIHISEGRFPENSQQLSIVTDELESDKRNMVNYTP